MKIYRSDIDGLRALAVIPVVLFHAGFMALSGGFVGVDIFFVISGFLITGVLLEDMAAQRYSIAYFYERRIRRIFPALILVLFCVVLAGFFLELPEDLKDLGHSLWSVCLFASNIVFWQNSGDYFGVKSEFQPLLHTWSLAVEEQFYIVFPVFLALVHKVRNKLVLPLCIIIVFVASLLISVVGVRYAPVANFYLLPSRAWELLAGSILAVGMIKAPIARSRAQIEALLGLALIVGPIFFYTGRTPFPGITALPPVMGACLILHAGMSDHPTWVKTLLSHPVARFFGLISYSLYLWHWPIIVFSRYYLIELDLTDRLVIVAASVVAATLSWRFVEKPFRGRDAVFRQKSLFIVAVLILLAGCAVGVFFARAAMPGRVAAEIVRIADKKSYHGPGRECGGAFARKAEVKDLCIRGDRRSRPDVLLVGDSHADAVAAAVFEAASSAGRSGYQITDTGYRPVLGYRKVGEEAKYAYLNALVTKLLDANPQIRFVILPVYWHQAASIDTYVNDRGEQVSGDEGMAAGFTALVDRYPDKRFLLILPSAHSLAFGGSAAARASWYGHADFRPVVDRARFMEEEADYAPVLQRLGRNTRVSFARLSNHLCDDAVCRGTLPDGSLAYADDNHISFRASRLIEPEIRQFLKPATAPEMGNAERGE